MALLDGAREIKEIFKEINKKTITLKTPGGVRQSLEALIKKEFIIKIESTGLLPNKYSLTKKGEEEIIEMAHILRI